MTIKTRFSKNFQKASSAVYKLDFCDSYLGVGASAYLSFISDDKTKDSFCSIQRNES